LKNQQKIDKLNKDIRPYVLRRLKENVEHNVPPKEETIVEVELTVLQKQCNRESYLKGLVAKDHLEKPLHNGAYDIFIENKAGSSQQESTNFITQDIDTILERRAKVSIHDKIGNKRNLTRRSFSKASLKELSETSGSTDEVHLDNPDWKK
jgi:SNF2 family DNA or RNA helicase